MGLRPIFDVFGTLLRPISRENTSVPVLARLSGLPEVAVQTALRRRQAPAERGQITSLAWMSAVCHELSLSPADWHSIFTQLIEAMAQDHVLSPETKAMLEQCTSDGQPVGILSNVTPIGLSVAQRFSLQAGGLVTHAAYSCAERVIKPDQASYWHAALIMDRSVDQCVLIDDDLSCIAGALIAGMPAVLVLHEYGSHAHLMRDNGQLGVLLDLSNTSERITQIELGQLTASCAELGLAPQTPIQVAADLAAAVGWSIAN